MRRRSGATSQGWMENMTGQRRPQRLAPDREARGAVGDDRPAQDVFEHDAGLLEVLAELLGRHAVDEAVPEAVTADLVPGVGDLADEAGEAVADPAQHEESGTD